jgi:hypothetical protein
MDIVDPDEQVLCQVPAPLQVLETQPGGGVGSGRGFGSEVSEVSEQGVSGRS